MPRPVPQGSTGRDTSSRGEGSTGRDESPHAWLKSVMFGDALSAGSRHGGQACFLTTGAVRFIKGTAREVLTPVLTGPGQKQPRTHVACRGGTEPCFARSPGVLQAPPSPGRSASSLARLLSGPAGLGGRTWQVGCFRGLLQPKLSGLHLPGVLLWLWGPSLSLGKLFPTVQEMVNVPLGSACYKTSKRMEAQEISAFRIRLCRGAGGQALSHTRLS